jgi:hypothetical protein
VQEEHHVSELQCAHRFPRCFPSLHRHSRSAMCLPMAAPPMGIDGGHQPCRQWLANASCISIQVLPLARVAQAHQTCTYIDCKHSGSLCKKAQQHLSRKAFTTKSEQTAVSCLLSPLHAVSSILCISQHAACSMFNRHCCKGLLGTYAPDGSTMPKD